MSAPALEGRRIDSDQYRAVMRHLPTGVAAICSTDPVTGAQNGMIVGTFASLSMEPPLVTFSVTHTSTSWPKIAEIGRFSVSLLSDDQQQVCRALSAKGEDKFSAVNWSESGWGTPHIHGSLAWFDCRTEQQIVAGDHLIVVASVLEMTPGEGTPLIFHGGRFGSFREIA
ncbi:FMN reductase (NADH) NtaB [Arthrobacter sp. Bi83]|jgi:3-hydroxy-9,10-secoandrosta-1,3,5(10)-triene-9,17-dione monooxygenase reductase component|uniref:flavin reductase family protein n=1 Tax=Arthrobacter sp. Bi83 TaxID=2822353 RepID=UPI001D7028F8|nr:flavin reductase family protein [Arthrobacter sp. Bi83]CAH0290599.1 FMN reductase (NADH) NtaB [Arthrobacter sp. Bi83]